MLKMPTSHPHPLHLRNKGALLVGALLAFSTTQQEVAAQLPQYFEQVQGRSSTQRSSSGSWTHYLSGGYFGDPPIISEKENNKSIAYLVRRGCHEEQYMRSILGAERQKKGDGKSLGGMIEQILTALLNPKDGGSSSSSTKNTGTTSNHGEFTVDANGNQASGDSPYFMEKNSVEEARKQEQEEAQKKDGKKDEEHFPWTNPFAVAELRDASKFERLLLEEEWWMKNKNYFVEVEIEELGKLFNTTHFLKGNGFSAHTAKLTEVRNFPLIGQYRISTVNWEQNKILLQPSCFVFFDELPSTLHAVPLQYMPEGIQGVIKRATGFRQMEIPIRSPLPGPPGLFQKGEEIVKVPQEMFYLPYLQGGQQEQDLMGYSSTLDEMEIVIVETTEGHWVTGMMNFLEQRPFELNDTTRFLVIALLTFSGLANLGEANADP